MTGFWLASYVVLWVVVVLVLLLQVGVLRQIGLIHREVPSRPPGEQRTPPLEADGPPFGSPLPELTLSAIDGSEVRLGIPEHDACTLVIFMAATCEGCQMIAQSLNEFLLEWPEPLRSVTILRGHIAACRSFIGIFPLSMPVVVDTDGELTLKFDVHHNPSGLLYDGDGRLIRRGSLVNRGELLALMGDDSAPPEALANVFPRPRSVTVALPPTSRAVSTRVN